MVSARAVATNKKYLTHSAHMRTRSVSYRCHPIKIVYSGGAYDVSNRNPRWTQKPIYTPIFTYLIWSSLLCTSVIEVAHHVHQEPICPIRPRKCHGDPNLSQDLSHVRKQMFLCQALQCEPKNLEKKKKKKSLYTYCCSLQ